VADAVENPFLVVDDVNGNEDFFSQSVGKWFTVIKSFLIEVERRTMAKGYIIGLIKYTDPERFIENFASKIGSLVNSNGGRFLTRTPESHFDTAAGVSVPIACAVINNYVRCNGC
jgi:hypothetical protein